MNNFPSTFDGLDIECFSTCPPISKYKGNNYAKRVAEAARWSEDAGCTGILIYTDHSEIDPWLVAQIILANTRYICPLIAVQPIYMHPVTVAKMICSLASLYGRRVYLNMVAGGFKNDLISMNDEANHDQRYERLAEYTEIIQLLLYESMPKTFSGKYYQIKNLWLSQQLPRELSPGIFMSGSSAAALTAARRLEATVVQYPLPDAPPPPEDLRSGWRIGIIARPTREEAWQVARARFPQDRGGKFMHNMAVTVSDSSWYQQLSHVDVGEEDGNNPYWLSPFKNYQTMCPYLVGSYECVAQEISRFFKKGSETFIFDIPETQHDLAHAAAVFAMARARKAIAI